MVVSENLVTRRNEQIYWLGLIIFLLVERERERWREKEMERERWRKRERKQTREKDRSETGKGQVVLRSLDTWSS